MNFMGDLGMLTREQLQGVLISIAKPQFLITRDERYSTGYCVRLSVKITTNVDLCNAISRSLLHIQIKSKVKNDRTWQDGKVSVLVNKIHSRGFLIVNGNDNLYKLLELIPKTLPANADWLRFSQALESVKDGKHQTQEGLDKLFEIKGLL